MMLKPVAEAYWISRENPKMNENEKRKKMHETDLTCPHCGKLFHVTRVRETITPAVKGEYKEVYKTDKTAQKQLSK
jgi:C4-type Zn-finger protein